MQKKYVRRIADLHEKHAESRGWPCRCPLQPVTVLESLLVPKRTTQGNKLNERNKPLENFYIITEFWLYELDVINTHPHQVQAKACARNTVRALESFVISVDAHTTYTGKMRKCVDGKSCFIRP